MQYRLFFFDNARIVDARAFEAADDIAAIKLSEKWREGRKMELWQYDRKVMWWD